MRLHRATEEQVDRCATLYAETQNIDHIATRVNLSRSRVQQILKYGHAQGWCVYAPEQKVGSTKEEIIAELKRVYALNGLGGEPLTLDLYDECATIPRDRVYRVFGNFSKALRAADLPAKERKTLKLRKTAETLPVQGGKAWHVYKPSELKQRVCLGRCGKPFESKWPGRRICDACTRLNDYILESMAEECLECA